MIYINADLRTVVSAVVHSTMILFVVLRNFVLSDYSDLSQYIF